MYEDTPLPPTPLWLCTDSQSLHHLGKDLSKWTPSIQHITNTAEVKFLTAMFLTKTTRPHKLPIWAINSKFLTLQPILFFSNNHWKPLGGTDGPLVKLTPGGKTLLRHSSTRLTLCTVPRLWLWFWIQFRHCEMTQVRWGAVQVTTRCRRWLSGGSCNRRRVSKSGGGFLH